MHLWNISHRKAATSSFPSAWAISCRDGDLCLQALNRILPDDELNSLLRNSKWSVSATFSAKLRSSSTCWDVFSCSDSPKKVSNNTYLKKNLGKPHFISRKVENKRHSSQWEKKKHIRIDWLKHLRCKKLYCSYFFTNLKMIPKLTLK